MKSIRTVEKVADLLVVGSFRMQRFFVFVFLCRLFLVSSLQGKHDLHVNSEPVASDSRDSI